MSNGETMEDMTNDTQPGIFVAWFYIISGAVGLILSISAIAQSYMTAGSAFVWLLLLAQLGAAVFGGVEVIRQRTHGYKTLYWVSLSCIPVIGTPILTYYSAIGIGLMPTISFGVGYGGTSFLFKFGYDSSLQFLSGSDIIILGVNLAAVGLAIYFRSILKNIKGKLEKPVGAIDTVVKITAKAEYILEKTYDADGRGLHEKLSSVEGKISPALVKKLRYVATIRNKLVHEYDYELENSEEFYNVAKQAISELEQLKVHALKETESSTSEKVLESKKVIEGTPKEESPFWVFVLFLLFIYLIYQTTIWFL